MEPPRCRGYSPGSAERPAPQKLQTSGCTTEYAAGAKVSELCRKNGMSDATLYKWKSKYGGLQGEPCAPLVQAQWRASCGG